VSTRTLGDPSRSFCSSGVISEDPLRERERTTCGCGKLPLASQPSGVRALSVSYTRTPGEARGYHFLVETLGLRLGGKPGPATPSIVQPAVESKGFTRALTPVSLMRIGV
jgi:hypothetical protein